MLGLVFYRFIFLTLWLPWLLLRQGLLVLRRKIPFSEIRERFGEGPQTGGAMVWIHGASLGELGPARHLVDAILERAPDISVVVTANASYAASLVKSWNLDRVHATLAPLDTRWAVRRFLSGFNCTHHITIENELWPNRFILLARRNIPIIALSARLSDRSVKSWRILGSFPRYLVSLVSHAAAQSAESRANLLALGLPADRLLPDLNLKALVPPAPPDPAALAQLAPHFRGHRVILGASTHPEEELALCRAFAALLGRHGPGLRLILAPRKVSRGTEIAEMARGLGLSVAQRSRDEAPDKQVYVADTLFEMPLWYSLSELCFVGGSLADYGGHTPFEPIAYNSVVLHGSFVRNFESIYGELDAAGGAVSVTADGLADDLFALLDNPEKMRALKHSAKLTVESKKDPLSPFIDTFMPSKARG